MPTQPLRIGIVQFAPLLGQVEHNTMRAWNLCSRIRPGTVDLVCLPEMIFTGYVFRDAQAIKPFLEEPRTGPTSLFCEKVARHLRSYVAAGYPERLSEEELGSENHTLQPKVGANSAILYGPDGEWIGGYRKTNLYDTDKSWAKPGTGFSNFHLGPPLNNMTIGICMDLNPQSEPLFSLEEGPYEIANYCLGDSIRPRTNLLVLLNAWLDTKEEPENDWDLWTLEYWKTRLRPLWSKSPIPDKNPQSNSATVGENETIVVICNRAGEDSDVLFAGTSALLKLREKSGEPEIVGLMKRRDEGVRVWTV